MFDLKFLFVLGSIHAVVGQWGCTVDTECSDVTGAVCNNGVCGCPTGKQIALSGTACVDLAPYHTSTCVEDHQCSRLFSMFECRVEANQTQGACACQTGHHYFHGRCWPSADFGQPCSRGEQCITTPRDPYSLQCNTTCACADGYYERQRGECRRIAYGVGDACVVNEDCQFTNGECEINSRTCTDGTGTKSASKSAASNVNVTLTAVNARMTADVSRSHGVSCSVNTPCPEPLECSFGACICPVGYYLNDDGSLCNAELGSPSTGEQCVGLLAEVIDGVCRCPNNFFYEENMRDCIRVTRRIEESCVVDENCHTFGVASICGEGDADNFYLRSCECDRERSVWDQDRNMCRLFAGIGEVCETDSDCLAGELEIQCVNRQCTCPAGLTAVDGLCLTTGLGLGEVCQATPECTGTLNTACVAGVCSCDSGYQEQAGMCAPIIGGTCDWDLDCVIENTTCVNETNTCQCRNGFVPDYDYCWPVSAGYESGCNLTAQCTETLGPNSICVDGRCVCDDTYHHRDGGCWQITGLFDACSRTSQCYLESMSERVVCRNSICQCDFTYPYSEELNTCVYSSGTTILSSATIVAALMYLVI